MIRDENAANRQRRRFNITRLAEGTVKNQQQRYGRGIKVVPASSLELLY